MPSILPVNKQLHRDMCCMFWTLPLVLQYCEAMSMTVSYRINCLFSDQQKSICHVKLLLTREQFKLNIQLSIYVTDWVVLTFTQDEHASSSSKYANFTNFAHIPRN